MSVASVENGRVTMGDDDLLYEIVAGERKELAPMSARETGLASLLLTYLNIHALERGVGRAVTEMLFDLGAKVDRSRRPDVAFVSYDRWPQSRLIPRINAWPLVPDLAVEVVSPSNTFEEVIEKMQEYFQAGVRLVWVVIPGRQVVYSYTTPTAVRIVTRENELTAEPVLPDFRLPLTKLFEEGSEE
jgi:Uma2 family endonuclease